MHIPVVLHGRDILAEVVIPMAVHTPAMAVVVTVPVLGLAAMYAAVVALAAAIVVASPLLSVWLRRGRTRWWEIASLGGCAGASCPLLLIGAFTIWDLHGIESGGIVLTLLATVIGTATGAAYWLLFVRTNESPRSSSAAAAGMCLLAIGASYAGTYWPAQAWPRYSERRERLFFSWTFGAATDERGTREVRLWPGAKPYCVVSIYLPELADKLRTERPDSILVGVTRIREDYGRLKRTRVDSVQSVQVATGPLTFVQGCQSWLEPR